MFEKDIHIRAGEKLYPLHLYVSGSEPLPMVFQFWMGEVARDFLRLGVYFRAVGIMLQIPGAAAYEFFSDESEAFELIRETKPNILLNVLVECLDRLGVKELMEQVPAPDYYEEELPEAWTTLLDEREKMKNGLLHVVAECLDELMVKPGMTEIADADEPHWWHRWHPEAT